MKCWHDTEILEFEESECSRNQMYHLLRTLTWNQKHLICLQTKYCRKEGMICFRNTVGNIHKTERDVQMKQKNLRFGTFQTMISSFQSSKTRVCIRCTGCFERLSAGIVTNGFTRNGILSITSGLEALKMRMSGRSEK